MWLAWNLSISIPTFLENKTKTLLYLTKKEIKILSRLELGLSHLKELKFKYSFPNLFSQFWSCQKSEVDISSHQLLQYSNYYEERFRDSHQRCSIKKGALRNFAKFTGKYLCQSLFFNKVAVFKPATLLKERIWHRCFPVNFAKFLKRPFCRTHLDDCFWRQALLKSRKNNNISFLQQSDSKFTSVLLFDDTSFGNNKSFLDDTIDYIMPMGRFAQLLFSSS